MVIRNNRSVLQFKFFFARARAHAFELRQNMALKSTRFFSAEKTNETVMKTQIKRRIAMPLKTLKVTNLQMQLKAYKRPTLVIVLNALFLGALAGNPLASDDSDLQLGTSNGNSQFAVQSSNLNDVFSVNSSGGVNISSSTIMPGTTFFVNGSATISTATISVNAMYGAGIRPNIAAGVCTTVTIKGTDNFGQINCLGSVATGVLFTVTQTIAAPTMWNCLLEPANTNASYASGAGLTSVFVSTTSAQVWTATNAGTNLAVKGYLWNYICGGF